MKPLAITLVLLAALAFTLPQSVSADKADLYDETADGRAQIDAAVKQAKTENKFVLITWGANWCGWCHHLEEQMQASETVQQLMKDHFVAIHIDLGHRDKHMELAKEYELDFTQLKIAHLTVLDAQGKVVGQQKSGDRVVVGKDGEKVYSAEIVAKFLEECLAGDD